MKMYGLAYVMEFPCLCFGKKGWYFKLLYSSIKKKFVFYHWWDDTKSIWAQKINSHPFKFFGLLILPDGDIVEDPEIIY